MNNNEFLTEYSNRINQFLDSHLPSKDSCPSQLHAAIRYSVMNGGKRLRAMLTYQTGKLLGADLNALDRAAAAIELIHAFTLIHDDLPALDNDDLRRGVPSCHKAFNEYTAILAGDALQSMAFEMLTKLRKNKSIEPSSCLHMIETLSHAIGPYGLAAGEHMDLSIKDFNHESGEKNLELIYKLKTGKLIYASVILGVLAANCHDKMILNKLTHYAFDIGIAFQIHDDILEIESNEATLGKSTTSDQKNNKPTIISLVDLAYAKKRRDYFYDRAMKNLHALPFDINDLSYITELAILRKN